MYTKSNHVKLRSNHTKKCKTKMSSPFDRRQTVPTQIRLAANWKRCRVKSNRPTAGLICADVSKSLFVNKDDQDGPACWDSDAGSMSSDVERKDWSALYNLLLFLSVTSSSSSVNIVSHASTGQMVPRCGALLNCSILCILPIQSETSHVFINTLAPSTSLCFSVYCRLDIGVCMQIV